jgi:SAM-dependent methyltransferase
MAATYTIDGGHAGKARLDVLARVCEPGTRALLDRVGIPNGATCVDLGCGGGHVARELAVRVGPLGRVIGIDFDPTVIELARQDTASAGPANVEFRVGDVTSLEPATYDVVYARFLLSHLEDPAKQVAIVAEALEPGGIVILEDVDFRGYFCDPQSAAHDRYVALYRQAVRRRGGHPDLGPALPGLLRVAGFEDIDVAVSQACAVAGEPKLIPPLTMERIAQAVIDEDVATADDVSRTIQELYAQAQAPNTVMGMPRVVQTWAKKPSLSSE